MRRPSPRMCARSARRSSATGQETRVPETEAELRIGVRFAVSADPGELFADARAVEAAGVDGIWVDASDGDPYVLLAAFAAVTWRVRLVAKGEVGRAACRGSGEMSV